MLHLLSEHRLHCSVQTTLPPVALHLWLPVTHKRAHTYTHTQFSQRDLVLCSQQFVCSSIRILASIHFSSCHIQPPGNRSTQHHRFRQNLDVRSSVFTNERRRTKHQVSWGRNIIKLNILSITANLVPCQSANWLVTYFSWGSVLTSNRNSNCAKWGLLFPSCPQANCF